VARAGDHVGDAVGLLIEGVDHLLAHRLRRVSGGRTFAFAWRLASGLGSGGMSGLLRPVGPEPVQTYWARRALALGAAMVLAIAVALIISGASSGSAAQPNPPADAYSVGFATTSMRPVKLQAKRKAKNLDAVMVPESGPGTYQAAKKSVRSKSSYGALIRYDVRVEDGLSIDPGQGRGSDPGGARRSAQLARHPSLAVRPDPSWAVAQPA
jgi:hypothetical protein